VDAFKERLDARAIYLHYSWEERSKLHKAVSYAVKLFATWRLLFRHKPAVFYVQAPPTFPVYAAFLYSALTGAKYIVDAHNPMINGSYWNKMPLAKAALRKAATVIVHNTSVAQQAQAQQLPHTVLMDRPPEVAANRAALPKHLNGGNGRPRVVVPCSYDVDEPLAELQSATRELAHVDFYLTWYVEKMPAPFASGFGNNVIFTGFLPLPEFNGLLASADAILVLTTQDGTQPSGATEALAFAKPLIVSDLQIIRQLFPAGAVYVKNRGAAIAEGIQQALQRQTQLAAEMTAYKTAKLQAWENQFATLQEKVYCTPIKNGAAR
jgi:hypothetical protein